MTQQQQLQQEEQLPIDIDYAKLLDWLVDRQRIPRNWHILLKSARTLTRTALSNTPSTLHEPLNIPSLTPHQNLPYYTVRAVFQKLTDPSAPPEWGSQEKDLFARYKSSLHRSWSDALSAFEKKHAYLADAAQQLVHNADSEAPTLKASIVKLNTDIADSVRREGTSVRAAQDAKQRFLDACREFELDPDRTDYETQLIKRVDERVPKVLAEVVQLIKEQNFGDALKYYQEFANFTAKEPVEDLCSTVKEVRQGDVDQLTRKVKEVPQEIQWGGGAEVDMPAPLNDDSNAAEVDWGIEVDTSGIEIEASGERKSSGPPGQPGSEAAINWDVENTATSGGIDWGDNIATAETTATSGDADNTQEVDALTLADAGARERCLTDLLELAAFLRQRTAELSRSAESEIGLVVQQSSIWPNSIKRVSTDRVKDMQAGVDRAIEGINSGETRKLLALQSNRKRLERAARAVVEKKLIAERTERSIGALQERRARAGQELVRESSQLKELGNVTRDVKRWTEEALSEMFRGRAVNILGEINNVFPPVD